MQTDKRWLKAIAAAALLATLAAGYLYGQAYRQAALAAKFIRLHVIANSDSPGDQALKLKVRDAIVAEMTPRFGQVTQIDEARALVDENIERLETIAGRVLRENGSNDTVRAVRGQSFFPTRIYGDLVLPAGSYEALRVIIGAGKGQNWWCVLFPPLCFVDITNRVTAGPAAQATSPAVSLVAEPDGKAVPIEVRFKILELFKHRGGQKNQAATHATSR